ncbi:alpha/beta hydrolase fold domain-containing protein [Brevibacterium casei]|uniref:Acetyl esterase n=1 Tax=Brevibacterium casei CIP 102111 TaxID=1255625 RepID=A0A2H1HWL2_9MICO|nr:alpha/beta hydrolase fold domain-containing protein [Brevibacterium casei]MCT1550808.1 alpha/beta hydrolase fold domain-containing protein [Brevibacterium casei]MCT1559115.1 alpha/beta hydrolase fold domain-containing protein [Brevibacterium casei]MCT2206972.1 alpha/beta hydrolase fold domain-containing protein [Brevibacterium casei]QPR38218.1 alpha/beta hydrolase fold domain-containing protein [Brevibacterium casei]QPR42383.1 alpha/beta hydrolase fold domain-containing protein [Brevibacter
MTHDATSPSPQGSTMPRDIREALSTQMREVLRVQDARAAECRKAADDVVTARMGREAVPDDSRDALAPTEFAAARAEYRAERAFWNEDGPTMAQTLDANIRVGDVEVRVRIHRPSDDSTLPGVVFLHGGGFSLGDLDTHDRIARVIAVASGAAVIAVDYSLSPEAIFPQALLECAAVIDRLVAHGGTWGIDGSRLAVAGDSAGAMLALGAALLLRDEPERIQHTPERVGVEKAFTSIRALLLFYGGHGLTDSESRRLFGGAWDGMTPEALASIATLHYSSPADAESPYVNHLGADLRGLPPTFIAAAGLDPLRDDSRALAALLRRAGTEVEYIEYPQVLHSFLHFGRMLDEANAALEAASTFAASHLGRVD